MKYMNAALPDGKKKRVVGIVIGNLFVHRRIYASLTPSCRWIYRLTNQYQVSQFHTGYSLGECFRFSSEKKALAIARKLDNAIPQLKNSVQWFTRHGKPIGEKARKIANGTY